MGWYKKFLIDRIMCGNCISEEIFLAQNIHIPGHYYLHYLNFQQKGKIYIRLGELHPFYLRI